MAQRLVRAKGKIRDARHPVPRAGRRRPARTGCGPCSPSSTSSSTRATRPARATGWSARTCAPRRSASAGCWPSCMPDEPEVHGAARADAADRVAPAPPAPPPAGDLVLLADQDRGRWDRELIAEGQALVRAVPAAQPARARTRSRRRSTPCTATPRRRRPPTGGRSCSSTTSCWRSRPSPVVALQPRGRGGRGRRAGGGAGPRRRASTSTATTCSTPIRADLLRRLGRDGEAAAAYEAAIARTDNAAERAFSAAAGRVKRPVTCRDRVAHRPPTAPACSRRGG